MSTIKLAIYGLIFIASAVHSVTFKTTDLLDQSSSNYLKFTGKHSKNSDGFKKIVADFNNDGHDDIISLGGNIPCPLCEKGVQKQAVFMEIMLYQDGEYIPHKMAIESTSNYAISIDIDQDTDLDIIMNNGYIAINDGHANFNLQQYSNKSPLHGKIFCVDWDQDDDLDIISKSHIFINDGNLNFTPETNTQAAKSQLFIVANLNSDQIPDLLIADDRQLQSWKNTGTGQLELIQTLSSNKNITSLHALDINADGADEIVLIVSKVGIIDDDILLLNNDGQGYLNISDSHFPQIHDQQYNTLSINQLITNDADNDGDLDLWVSVQYHDESSCSYQHNLMLIYANQSNNTLQFRRSLHSIGYEQFDSHSSLSAAALPTLIDLNNDKLTDVVMTGEKPVVWLQDKGFQFSMSHASSFQFNNHLDVIDFNKDGYMDLLSSAMYDQPCAALPYAKDTISSTNDATHGMLWLGNGQGKFKPYEPSLPKLLGFNESYEYSKIVDLAQDGNFQVIYTFPAYGKRPRQSIFQLPLDVDPLIFSRLPEPTKLVEVADLNNNGQLEIVMLADNAEAAIYVLELQASLPLRFNQLSKIEFGARNGELKLADMDADGNTDIITNSKAAHNAITIWYNDGAGHYHPSTPFANEVQSITIADFNGDAALDIFSSNSDHEIWINQNNRQYKAINYDTIFWYEKLLGNDQQSINLIPQDIELMDINQDGLADLFTLINGKLHVFMNNSHEHISFYKNYSNQLIKGNSNNQNEELDIAFADFNNDGLLDYASAGSDGIKINTQIEQKISSGLYYDTEHSGHGFSIEALAKDNLYYSVFYSYDENGKSDWYSMLNRYQAQQNLWKLSRINGNNYIHYRYDYATQSTRIDETKESRGWLTFFNDKGSDFINKVYYQIGDEKNIWNIKPIIAPSQKPSTDFSGIWWAGENNAGWGLSLSFIQRPTTQEMIAILYFYDDAGRPRWLIGQTTGFKVGQQISINMNQINGYGRQQQKLELTEISAGTLTLKLKQASNILQQAGTLDMNIHYPDDQRVNDNWVKKDIAIALFSKPRNR
jgi:hypothetical protein